MRRCLIKGYTPLILYGANKSGFNYAMHMEDNTKQKPLGQNPHGDNISTTTFSLEVLYDQYKRFMNTWSYPNNQLALPAAPADPQQANPQWPGKNNNNGPRGENKDGAAADEGYQPEDIDALVAALEEDK